jgi:hypothetical protein
MIRITVELVPKGWNKHARVIGRMLIHNDMSGNGKLGNYVVRVFKQNDAVPFRTGRVEGFKRKSQSAWQLVLSALETIYKGEPAMRHSKPVAPQQAEE